VGGKCTAAKVGEVDEQALLTLSLLPSGEWIKAVYVCYVCGGLWSFQDMFTNWACLQGKAHYLPLYKLSLQSSENELLEVHLLLLASNNANPSNVVLEVPEWLHLK
jgi:hypothetical protein